MKRPPVACLVLLALLTVGVERAAPMPADPPPDASSVAPRPGHITEKDQAHWAFQPVQRPALPARTNAIDALVRAALHAQGLSQNPPATPRELIRRVYFDLIGLPPAPEEVASFASDPSPDRYDKVIDHLLASPHYGERWGRHWLDLARFAQSNGYERDGEKPLAWRYRDYVIKAFNDDKPYDRFVLEQLAGDELPEATAEAVAATGFQRLGVWDDEPDDKRLAEFDALDDVLSTAGTAFLGLTLGCARCHDHKFDAISQVDYYALLAFFRGLRPFESKRDSFDAPGFAPLAAPGEVHRWLIGAKAKEKQLEAERTAATDGKEKKRLEGEIKKLYDDAPFEWTLAVRERGGTPPATHVLRRGNPATPGAGVEPAFLPVLHRTKPVLPAPAAEASSSGRRLALARWIASAQNPLTARVMVNRIWQHHFGQGLVKTPSDFGRAGAPPTHPALLDWLAAEFVEGGWSIKGLHKLVLRSATYRQSSRAEVGRARAVDPANHLLWRQNLRRLEAEAVRDAVLSIAGTLHPAMGGRGFFPHLSGEVLAGQSRPGLDWEVSSAAEQCRRSVYAYVRRTMPVPLLESFDYSNTTSPQAERAISTVAPQALLLLNDDFLQGQAAALAERLVREAGAGPARQIQRAYQLAVSRDPDRAEMKLAEAFLRRQTAACAGQATRLTFRPDVAQALAGDYFDKLPPSHFLIGPLEGWSYHRGVWAPPYEGIRVVERARGPFALWQGTNFEDGIIETRVLLSKSTERVGLLFRAKAEGDGGRGCELVLDPRARRITWRVHESESRDLAQAAAEIPAGAPFALKLEFVGPRLRVWLDGGAAPVLDASDERARRGAGAIGVRTWGGAVSLDELTLRDGAAAGAAPVLILPGGPDPERRALQAFCLLVLNLNEVMYVD